MLLLDSYFEKAELKLTEVLSIFNSCVCLLCDRMQFLN